MDEGTRFLILSLDGGKFALPITRLLEITVARGIQKDPNLTAMFEGKVQFRGKFIPVLNLKKLLKLSGQPGPVLLAVKGEKVMYGIQVDAVTEILDSDQKPLPLPDGVLNPAMRTYAGLLRHKGDLILLLHEDGLLQ